MSPPPLFFFDVNGVTVQAVGAGGVYTRNGVSISRGYADEAASIQPTVAQFTLDNKDLRYGDNPLSPYYGHFGQGTPFRIAAHRYPTVKGLWTPSSFAGGASTPDSVALSIVGDLDLSAEVPVYKSGYYFVSKSLSYALRSVAGFLQLQWVKTAVTVTRTCTAAIPAGHTAFRATLDVDNGAAGHTVVFYSAAAWGDPWVQLGATSITAGVTSIDNSADAAFLGGTTTTLGPLCVRRAEIRSGIGGTVVASPNPAAQADGTLSFADAQANTWTVDVDSDIGLGVAQTRFLGEVSKVTLQRDTSDTDHYAALEVSGPTQRLRQGGGTRVRTALESWIPARTATSFRAAAYWPLDEGSGAVSGRSRLGGADMVFTRPTNPVGRFGAGDTRLPWLNKGVVLYSGDRLRGVVNMAAPTATGWEFAFLYACQDGADMTISLNTTAKTVWTIQILPGTNQIGFSAPGGGMVLANDLSLDLFDGVSKLVMFRVWENTSTPTTADAYIVVSSNYEGAGTFGTNDIIDDGFSIGVPNRPISRLESVEFEHAGLVDRPFVLSHVAAFSALDLTGAYQLEVPAAGNILEQADARMTRVCAEKAVPFTTNSSYVTALMGPQKPTDLLSVVDGCARADMGLLFEVRDALSLKYRPLAELHNGGTVLTLDYAAHQVAPPFEPVRDDQKIRNDVTAKRDDGGEARYEQLVGRYSTADPAAGGVGRYDSTVNVNVRSDNQLGDIAGWTVHLGTWDEPRAPTVTVFLDTVSDALADTVLSVDIGDRIDIVNLQSIGIYDTVSLLVLGYEESWDDGTHQITFNCVAQRPYRVLKLDTPGNKVDSGSSTTAAAFTSGTSVTMSVAVSSPADLWATAGAAPFTVKVAGAVLNVTAVSGASSPQTFTVDAVPVNGVSKIIPVGSPIHLDRAATVAYARNP